MVAISAICIGIPRPFKNAEPSAIDKRPVKGPVSIRRFGIEGDRVADQVHHGGPDMAVHQYPHDHYTGWEVWLGSHPLLSQPAAFGENLVASGMVESQVSIGDRFRFGTALLEVSQPRQPCWKIEHRFDRKGMVTHIISRHICGWYYRVVEDGEARAGDLLEKIEEGHTGWTVQRVFAALYDPQADVTKAEFEQIASLSKLSEKLRDRARSR